MDATNERNIFELLLKEATKPGSAQYLFVTPKVHRDIFIVISHTKILYFSAATWFELQQTFVRFRCA